MLVGRVEGASGEENLQEQETLGGKETGLHGVVRGNEDTDQGCGLGRAGAAPLGAE